MGNAKWAFCSSLCGRTWSVWRGLSHGLGGNKCSGENGPPRHWQRHVDGSQVRKRDLGCLRSPYAGAVGENFILMDDNARAHRACITDQYLEQATIIRMEWPARSPDLNPIEHAWDMLQTAVSSRPVQPASVQELRQALLEEWDQIPQYKIRRLISSIRRRCQAVIPAQGHHTRY